MELRHLRYFIAVAEERGFTAAAERLRVAQPALSVQVRALEEEIGAPLFSRAGHRTELTEAGQAFLARARSVLASLAHAALEAKEIAIGLAGTVVLSFIASASRDLVPGTVRRMREVAPGVHLRLVEMTTTEQLAALQRGEVDLAIVRGPAAGADLTAEVLRRDPLRAIVPATHPLARRKSVRMPDLAEADFIFFPRHVATGLHDLIRATCLEQDYDPNVAHEASDFRTIVDLVAAGVGVTIQPTQRTGRIAEGVAACVLRDVAAASEVLLFRRKSDARGTLLLARDAVLHAAA